MVTQIAGYLRCPVFPALLLLLAPGPSRAQQLPDSAKALYDGIRSFRLTGPSLAVENLLLKTDRVAMTFTGAFVFTAPVADRVTGAVFQGQGTFQAPVPPSAFERENVRRLLKADSVESNFQTAVMIFTDETFRRISAGGSRRPSAAAPAEAQRLAADFLPRIMKETGINLAARAAESILNQEQPGFFCAQFDGGSRGRFSLLLDYQNRIPVANFVLNGGEKGLIFSYRQGLYGNDIWMAFYGLEDYDRGIVAYSDTQDLVDIQNYTMDLDLRDPKKALSLVARMDMLVRAPHLRALPLSVGENLPEYDEVRRKNQMRLKSARVGGAQVDGIQEDWEGGFTILLPTEVSAGAKLSVEVSLEGDFMRDVDRLPGCYYPYSNTSWYPRHGYLDRATYDLTFHHRNRLRIAATGLRVREEADPASKEDLVTEYMMTEPISIAAFALGPFERHAQKIKWEAGGETPLEFSSLPGFLMSVKEDFILAELDNAMRYFTDLFGKYPYPSFGAGVHPYGFGQGLPTLLMIPPASTANKETFAFISHETAHQWWGNIVAWRSYRDQWLSEGFAAYSGVIYAGRRDGIRSQHELIDRLRDSLKNPPRTPTGVGQGRLNDVGPIILGHRLETSQTRGTYSTLVYNKGALVLRMLHFLFMDSTTGSGQPFFEMMTAFVNRFRGKTASTDDFRTIANEHFLRTTNSQKYGLRNLDWFFNQWVLQVPLPSYSLEYTLEEQPGGAVVLRGTVFQENAPEDWFMLLPVTFDLGGNQVANANIRAVGPQTPVALKLPRRPTKVELDPDSWILSEKTSTRRR